MVKQKAIGCLHNHQATIARAHTSIQADQYYSMQGPVIDNIADIFCSPVAYMATTGTV